MAREDLDTVGELHQPAQRMEKPLGALDRADREVRTGGVADEERVAREHEPRLVRPGRVDHGEAAVLGPVPRRVDHPERDRADPDLVAVGERLVRVRRVGGGVDAHRHPVLEREPSVARDVVGVGVRLEYAHDAGAEALGLAQDRLDREVWIDDDRLLRALAADDVGGAPEIVVEDLREEHGGATVAPDFAMSPEVEARAVSPDQALGRRRRRTTSRLPAMRASPTAPPARARPKRCEGASSASAGSTVSAVLHSTVSPSS